MEIVHKLLFLLLTVFISVLNLTTFSDSRATNLGNHNPTSINTHESHAKGEGQTRIPFVDYTSSGKPVEYPYDPSGSLASVYIPASETGFQGPGIGKDGLEGAFLFNGYPQGGSYGYGYGYGYPNQGGAYGSPQGIFRFPQGIFRFARGIFGLPRNIFGSAGGYGGFPGGYGGNPGGYGGYPGGYGGNPGGYGGGQLGRKPGGGGYPGYGGKAEVKGTEANPHN